MSDSRITSPDVCPPCGSVRAGKFCANCGEKRLADEDFTLKKYALQALDGLTHFEGKFFKSFKLLMFAPGKLTIEYLEGRRVRLMKPVQLYVVVAIAFYFIFKQWDIFYQNLEYTLLERYDRQNGIMVPVDPASIKGWHRTVYDKALNNAHRRNITLKEFLQTADEHNRQRSKAFVFLLIPAISVFVYAVVFPRERRYIPHLVFSTHLFTFILSAIILIMGAFLAYWTARATIPNYAVPFNIIGLITMVYILLALRRAYQLKNVFWLLGATVFITLGILVSVEIYRQTLMFVSAWLG